MISIPPRAPTHLSSAPLSSSFLSARGTRLQSGGGSDSPSDKATKPCLTFHPFSSLIFLTHTCIYTFSLHSVSLCVGTESPGQAARQAGGLVCGTMLISTGIWRRKPRYLPPQPPPSPPSLSFFRSPSLRVSGGCFHHAACVARFVKDVAASCLFHGRLPTSSHIFRPLSFTRLFPALSLFFCPPPAVYLLMNSVSRARFCFPALSQGEFFFSGCYGALIGTSAQRYQGRAGRVAPRSANSLWPPQHHASSCNLCAVC